MMRFILGAIAGFAAGAAAVALTAGKSGDELRVEFERIRTDIQQRDFDALGSHLEGRFKDLQASLEQRLSQTGASVSEVAEDTSKTFESGTDTAADAAQSVADDLDSAVRDATEGSARA
jgi:gas vesicle protein